ncbi:MAG: hypothetical protein IPJ65_07750 [Archangiaceae bacterium]|nr:hypothetical protein [Archangiaceae bacterium]
MRRFALVFALVLLLPALSFATSEPGEHVLGAVLPMYARKVAELRYRVSEDWENIIKFYSREYPKKSYAWKNVVNQPGVKAFHIANPSGKGWEGINVYEANDEVRVYVVPVAATKTKASKSGKKQKEQ